MSWNETPAELALRIREQQDHQQAERERRAEAEREMHERQSTYVRPKDPSEMNPAELEAHRRANVERERSEREAQATRLMKDRARSAFINAGGKAEDFEAAYPTIRERVIQDEAVRVMQGQKRAGEFNNGTVNW
jgi:hypothetical protein